MERKTPEVVEGFAGIIYGTAKPWFVQVGDGSSTGWSKVEEDTNLNVGQHVRTDKVPDAFMKLREKRDEIRLPKETHIELRELSDDSEEVTIFLHSGSIWSEVTARSNPESFVVETPELTAGVRGTNFRVDRLNGASKVSVYEGEVRVKATKTGVFVSITANQSAVVNADGQILDLVATPVDEARIWDDWNDWAAQTVAGTGSLAAGFSPIGSLSTQIAQDNARWEMDMQEYMRNTAINRYRDKIDEYAAAFVRFADDTGIIPEGQDGWSLLRFDSGIPNWDGPYIDGAIPPLDPWKRPLVHKRTESRTGRVYGKVYSFGEDGRDQDGHATFDMLSHAMYFQLERFADDPAVNPPEQ